MAEILVRKVPDDQQAIGVVVVVCGGVVVVSVGVVVVYHLSIMGNGSGYYLFIGLLYSILFQGYILCRWWWRGRDVPPEK